MPQSLQARWTTRSICTRLFSMRITYHSVKSRHFPFIWWRMARRSVGELPGSHCHGSPESGKQRSRRIFRGKSVGICELDLTYRGTALVAVMPQSLEEGQQFNVQVAPQGNILVEPIE